MSEATAWSTMRKHLMALPGRVHIQRLEDKLTGGIPDTNVCWRGMEFWCEGKFVRDLPKRESTLVKIGLRADQALWLETRQRAGGIVFVWVRVRDEGWMYFSQRFRALQDGIALSDFLQEPMFTTCKEMMADIEQNLLYERTTP